MKKKVALITGINGQDGSYLAEFLLENDYEVHGIIRRNSIPESQTKRVDHIFNDLVLHYGDMTDMMSLINIIRESKPDEIYNLAAQSHVKISFEEPIYTTQVVAVGTLNLLEAIRIVNPKIRMYQASSSEMFGNSVDDDGFQRETTPMHPASPYGCAKLFAYNLTRNYRKSYGMFVSNGILFNHESPRRGSNFVTNKVCKEVIKIKFGLSRQLALGNLEATRDWGHAKDYVEAMWLMLQHDNPDDFVCSTGVSNSIRRLAEYAFGLVELDYRDYVVIDEKYYRPEDIQNLKGDSTKIRETLKWKPKYTFETMVEEMLYHWMRYYG